MVREFLLVFDDGNFSEFDTFTITDWFAHTPKDVLAANFGVHESAFARIPDKQRYIFQAKAPGPLENQKCRTRMEPYQKASHTGCLHKSLL